MSLSWDQSDADRIISEDYENVCMNEIQQKSFTFYSLLIVIILCHSLGSQYKKCLSNEGWGSTKVITDKAKNVVTPKPGGAV